MNPDNGLFGALMSAGHQMSDFVNSKMHHPAKSSLLSLPALMAAKDAVSTNDPNAQPTPGTQMTGIPGAFVKGVAAPVMNHPLASVLSALAAPALTGAVGAAVPAAGPGLVADDIGTQGWRIANPPNPAFESRAFETLSNISHFLR